MRKLAAFLFCLAFIVGIARAEELSLEDVEEKIFWSEHVDIATDWGVWLKEHYKPYADKMTIAMLKIVAATKDITYEGKTSEEVLAEIRAAHNSSLRSMEQIKAPPELKSYHKKLVALYKFTINSDPNEATNNALEQQKMTLEVDKAMTKGLMLRGVPQHIIDYINQN